MSLLRKLIHLVMALVPAAGWLASFPVALALAGALLGRRWWWKRHAAGDHGSTAGAVGALATLLLFGRDAGGTAVLFFGLGRPGGGAGGQPVEPPSRGQDPGGERRSPPPDDNVWMSILSGLAIVAVQWWLGG